MIPAPRRIGRAREYQVLCCGIDWAEKHHGAALVNADGGLVAERRAEVGDVRRELVDHLQVRSATCRDSRPRHTSQANEIALAVRFDPIT